MDTSAKKYHFNHAFPESSIPDSAITVRPVAEYSCPVFIYENFLTVEQCRFIANRFLAAGHTDAPGTRGANADKGLIRKAYSFALTGEAHDIYRDALDAVATSLAGFYGVSITSSSGAHGLGYTAGCKYDLHSDNCDVDYDTAGKFLGFRHAQPDRHLSTLVFLGDSVEEITGEYQHIGGNLSFRFLVDEQGEPLLIEPRCGLFVAFPSDPVFAHEVHEVVEVSSSYRFAIVDWHSCKPAVRHDSTG